MEDTVRTTARCLSRLAPTLMAAVLVAAPVWAQDFTARIGHLEST